MTYVQLLKEEAVEHVPEYTYLGQLIAFRDDAGKEIKKRELEWLRTCSGV
jgi:hypothetical protein